MRKERVSESFEDETKDVSSNDAAPSRLRRARLAAERFLSEILLSLRPVPTLAVLTLVVSFSLGWLVLLSAYLWADEEAWRSCSSVGVVSVPECGARALAVPLAIFPFLHAAAFSSLLAAIRATLAASRSEAVSLGVSLSAVAVRPTLAAASRTFVRILAAEAGTALVCFAAWLTASSSAPTYAIPISFAAGAVFLAVLSFSATRSVISSDGAKSPFSFFGTWSRRASLSRSVFFHAAFSMALILGASWPGISASGASSGFVMTLLEAGLIFSWTLGPPLTATLNLYGGGSAARVALCGFVLAAAATGASMAFFSALF